MSNEQQIADALFGEISDSASESGQTETTPDSQPTPGPRPTPSPQPTAEPPAKPPDAPKRPVSWPPRPGTSVQRSDRENRRKAILLLALLPPPKPRRRSCVATAVRSRPLTRPPTGASPGNSPGPATPDSPPAFVTGPDKAVVPAPGSTTPGTSPVGTGPSRPPPRLIRRPVPARPASTFGPAMPDPPPAGSGQPALTRSVGLGPRQPGTQVVTLALGDGTKVEVPILTAILGRKYRILTATGRWIIRFDRRGRPRSV
ncbi:uncharacterized protein [Linepithema humile]|uniref:uncharacterized protein n=1 Tax=Linepithema humile TaxID=83485 RepID=UPI00351EA7C9